MLLRLSGGEPLLHFPATIEYPMYDAATGTQYFPFKTLSMVLSLFFCVFGTLFSEFLFKNGILQPEYDILACVVNISNERVVLPTDTSFNVSSETLVLQKIKTENGQSNETSALTNGDHLHQDYLTVNR